jgi:hypothetical protein
VDRAAVQLSIADGILGFGSELNLAFRCPFQMEAFRFFTLFFTKSFFA